MGPTLAEAPSGEYSPDVGWLRAGVEEKVRTIITSHVDACVASGGGAEGTAQTRWQQTQTDRHKRADTET